jgi:hypothetical protein
VTNVPELSYQLVAAIGATSAVEFSISIPRLPEERDLVDELVLGGLPAVSGDFVFRKMPGIGLNGELTIIWLAVSKWPPTEPAPEAGFLKQTMVAEIENLKTAIKQERENRKTG